MVPFMLKNKREVLRTPGPNLTPPFDGTQPISRSMRNLPPILLKRPFHMEIGAVVQVVAFEACLPGLV